MVVPRRAPSGRGLGKPSSETVAVSVAVAGSFTLVTGSPGTLRRFVSQGALESMLHHRRRRRRPE